MTKEELTQEVIERLKKEYPLAVCTLDYNDAWKLLVSVRLAAQCTDARVNVVVKDLYAKFPDVDSLADAPVEDVYKRQDSDQQGSNYRDSGGSSDSFDSLEERQDSGGSFLRKRNFSH